jgi:murein DD-endopeptidase MepM/ murein hydrolase activator NlpD
MMRLVRPINLALCAVVVWQVLLLVQSKPALAQAPPFLYRPYYGDFPGWTAMFDHHVPNGNASGTFINWNDALPGYTTNIGVDDCTPVWRCYDGHEGVDFVLAYKPVVAAAEGQIDYAGWSSTNHDILLGLKMGINHWNNYRTVYGHLSMVRYQTQTNVGRWQIGTSGTTGNSSGPHLHFQVERYNNSKWRVTNPYGWRDRYNNYDNGDDPWANHQDGIISTWLWVDNPLQSPPSYGNSYYKDDGDSGFSTYCLSGNYWWTVNNAGYNNELRYTYVNGQTVNCWANWYVPALPSTGQYEVEVYVPTWNDANRTHAARYRVKHANGEQTVVVDQHRIGYRKNCTPNPPYHYCGAGEWISLGRYNFSQGSPATELVQLADAAYIGDQVDPPPPASYRTILADAVRWVKTH